MCTCVAGGAGRAVALAGVHTRSGLNKFSEATVLSVTLGAAIGSVEQRTVSL